MRVSRSILVALLLLLLLGLTGFVMSRNRRMSLFLEAKDRLAAGEDAEQVFHSLGSEVDWGQEEWPRAGKIADDVLGEGVPPGFRVYRAGPYALVFDPDGVPVAAERGPDGWRRLR